MSEQKEISRGDIYWSNQPFVKCHIQRGSRPYLVISSRNNKGYVTVLPITSKIKEIPNRYNITFNNRPQQVITDQPQTVPISTLGRFLDRITLDDVDDCMSVMLKSFDYVSSALEEVTEDVDYWSKLYFDSLNPED